MPAVSGLSENDRFHCFKIDYTERSITKAIAENRITRQDADLITTFIEERKITNGISLKRALKITSNLITVRKFIPPFKELTIASLYRGIDRMNSGMSSRGELFSNNTKIDLISITKQFCFWLIDNEEITLPEKKIKAIKVPKKIPTKTASDLLTSDEIQALLSACRNPRDRALLMTMYEGGFRVGELGEMKWGHLKIDGTGVVINVTFKTGKPRYIRLVMAKEHLIKWMSDYPEERTDDALVFLNEHRLPLTHAAITRQLGRLALRAGITKHITPHIFRHSRITHLIQQGVNESVIKLMMWGSIDSKMFINYAHLTGADIDREICKLYGIEPTTSQVTGDALEPKVCPHCREMNSPVSHYCHVCGEDLTGKSEKSADWLTTYLRDHPDLLVNYLNQFTHKS